MLVFSRKIGQQVVLPEQGITIDVVSAGKTRVRLGISAPADVPIHRGEVWDRAHGGGDNGPGVTSDHSANRLAADSRRRPPVPSPSFADLDQCLARWIVQRTGGRINGLSIERVDGRIVIRGSARSFFVRQLAQAAVNEVLKVYDRFSPGSVECSIDVAQVYWRSVGKTHGLAKLGGEQP